MKMKRPETWFPELVRTARAKQGLSQWNFAIKHGINLGTLCQWEQGRTMPTLKSLGVLIRALGEDAGQLMEIDQTTANTRLDFGRWAETLFVRSCEAIGVNCICAADGSPFDVLVDGVARVEVKASRRYGYAHRAFWQFNIHRHGILDEICDFYALACCGISREQEVTWVVLPAPLLTKVFVIDWRALQVKFRTRGMREFAAQYRHGVEKALELAGAR